MYIWTAFYFTVSL